MYEYLRRNKEWLFSGIGVVLLLVVISSFKSVLFDSGGRDRDTLDVVSEAGNVVQEFTVSSTHKVTQKSPSPVTLEEFYGVLISKTITELQRQNFIGKHEGRVVRWQGIVENVQQLSSTDDSSDIIVVYRPVSQKNESLPDLFTALFPFAAKGDMSSLARGDYIEFEGTLEILSRETFPSPSLSNCTLLKHEKVTNTKKL